MDEQRHRGADTRARIEREALRLFAEKGTEGTSVRDIAQAVGVADAALYRHFRSKDEIARHLFALHYGDLARRIEKIAARRAPFAQTARALVSLFCGLFDSEPDVFAFILTNQHAHLRFVGDSDNAVEPLRAIMRDAYARGEIAVADADLAAAIALGSVVQAGVFKLYGALPGPLSDRVEVLTRAVLAAVGCKGAIWPSPKGRGWSAAADRVRGYGLAGVGVAPHPARRFAASPPSPSGRGLERAPTKKAPSPGPFSSSQHDPIITR